MTNEEMAVYIQQGHEEYCSKTTRTSINRLKYRICNAEYNL